MNYRLLGRTGVRVSPLCMGTMTFGDSADEAESAQIFRALPRSRHQLLRLRQRLCRAGAPKIILGTLIADCRDEVVITSKSGFPVTEEINNQGSSRRHLQLQVEAKPQTPEHRPDRRVFHPPLRPGHAD